jgi:hypothetical protein
VRLQGQLEAAGVVLLAHRLQSSGHALGVNSSSEISAASRAGRSGSIWRSGSDSDHDSIARSASESGTPADTRPATAGAALCCGRGDPRPRGQSVVRAAPGRGAARYDSDSRATAAAGSTSVAIRSSS